MFDFIQQKSRYFGLAATLLLAGSVLLAGCGSSGQSGDAGAKKIIIGTGHAYEPYCYLDQEGHLTGYEYEVLKAVDELLPQYAFEYQTFDFANVLMALESGKVDIGAHQYEVNEERQKKYLFGNESYTTYTTYLTVSADNNDIHGLDDLQGKRVSVSTGSNSAYLLEKYNEQHADHPIELVYGKSPTNEELYAGLQSGAWVAIIKTKRDAGKLNKEFGNGKDIVKQVGDPIATSRTYFVFRKDEPELQEAVDGALKQLKESGRLAEISREVLGDDYTERE
ncbi:MAG TPA: L-cystine-binding protein TcyK [Selenomonas sp.]|jgi:L-cystine transport system substrate-binding protein|nr:L-cystine-binding protein TcyK [Selenomonas sp.]